MKATEAEIYRYRYEKALFELELKLGIQYNNQKQIAQSKQRLVQLEENYKDLEFARWSIFFYSLRWAEYF